jgi:hypothetical protein
MSKKRASQTRVVKRKARNRYAYHQNIFERHICLDAACNLVSRREYLAVGSAHIPSCSSFIPSLELHTHKKNATLYATQPSFPSSPQSPNDLLTSSLTFFSNSALLSLHILAASTLAGDSSFGSANILITLINIFSTLWIGLHRSEACS